VAWESVGSEAFLSLDGSLSFVQAREVIGKISPDYLVVRVPPTGEYFLLNAIDVLNASDATWSTRTLGYFVNLRYPSAVVVDTDDGWSPVKPDDIGKKADAVVVDADGTVARVVPSLRITGPDPTLFTADRPPGRSTGLHHLRAPVRFPIGTAAINTTAINTHWDEFDLVAPSAEAVPEPPDANLEMTERPTATEPAGDTAKPLGDDGAGDRVVEGGGGGGGGDDGGEVVALEVKLPDVVEFRKDVSLFVLLQPGPGGPGSAPLTAHADEMIEVLVAPSAGFTLDDQQSKSMTVRLGGETLPLVFKLHADVQGKGVVKVYAFRSGACVASVTVSAHIEVHPATRATGEATTLRVPAPPVAVAVADLDLTVFQVSNLGGVALQFRLTDANGTVLSNFAPQQLSSNPSSYVQQVFTEIQKLALEPGGWTSAKEKRLERIGAAMYESLIPADLQRVLWETQRVRSLLIQTAEPWIPWELCRMTYTANGTTRERDFLCDEFEMSRWLPGVPPKPTLTATRIGIIAPKNTGLASVPLEVDMLKKLKSLGPTVTRLKATYASVMARLGAHAFDVLHFSGHGLNADPDNASRSEFVLAGTPPLTPSDISGATRNLGLRTPLVFMNACDLAQASMGLHGIGGWAAAMTYAGAGAFIGTHWDVRDDLALAFSTAFYAELSKKRTVAAAVRMARRTIRDRKDTDATWLAYSVHVTPGATCRFGIPT
jgi:hypothetical protein